MFDQIQSLAGAFGIACAAIAIGAGWVAVIASPNCSFDELDGSRADRHVRELLKQTSTPISGMLLAAGALFVLGASWGAAATAFLAAFGFFSNRWMLAPKKGKNPRGVKTSRKGQRTVSISFSLIFLLAAVVAAVLGIIGL